MQTQHLIIGASGKTGSRVAKRLTKLGYQPKLAGRKGPVVFDWDDHNGWAQALWGVNSVYLTYYPDLAIPRAPEDIARFCSIAKTVGVSHITLLSGRGEEAAQVCELILRNSGMSWSIVRASWFNQNFSDGLFRQLIVTRKIALPVSVVKEPFVDVDDIADVAVATLTQEGHSGKLYEVTGPELLSFAQVAQRFSLLLDQPVEFAQISMEEFHTNLHQAGVDAGAIEMMTYLFSQVLDGRNESLCHGIEQALGRPATNFNQFILNNRHCFGEALCKAS